MLLDVRETGTGIDANATSIRIEHNGLAVAGRTYVTANNLRFVPGLSFVEGHYTVEATLVDHAGLSSTKFSSVFDIDQTPPAAPQATSYPATSRSAQVTLERLQRSGHSLMVEWSKAASARPGNHMAVQCHRGEWR